MTEFTPCFRCTVSSDGSVQFTPTILYSLKRRGCSTRPLYSKNVQISYELFVDLVLYHLNGEDDFDEEIQQGLEKKLDAMLNRQLYSQYKTAPTEEQREKARQEYLDRRGVPQSFRWTAPPWER